MSLEIYSEYCWSGCIMKLKIRCALSLMTSWQILKNHIGKTTLCMASSFALLTDGFSLLLDCSALTASLWEVEKTECMKVGGATASRAWLWEEEMTESSVVLTLSVAQLSGRVWAVDCVGYSVYWSFLLLLLLLFLGPWVSGRATHLTVSLSVW